MDTGWLTMDRGEAGLLLSAEDVRRPRLQRCWQVLGDWRPQVACRWQDAAWFPRVKNWEFVPG